MVHVHATIIGDLRDRSTIIRIDFLMVYDIWISYALRYSIIGGTKSKGVSCAAVPINVGSSGEVLDSAWKIRVQSHDQHCFMV